MRRVLAATLMSPTSTVKRPARRSAKMRVAREDPEPPSVTMAIPNFALKASKMCWYSGMAPVESTSRPSFFAAVIRFDHCFSKFAPDCAAAGGANAAPKERARTDSPVRVTTAWRWTA